MPRPTTPISEIVRQLLVNMGCGSRPLPTPGETNPWPIYVSQQPDNPDNVVTVYDTAGITEGRLHPIGTTVEQFGILIRVRSQDYLSGWQQVNKIVDVVDEEVYRTKVNLGSMLYTIQALTRRSAVNSLGRSQESGDREAFTVNYTVSFVV